MGNHGLRFGTVGAVGFASALPREARLKPYVGAMASHGTVARLERQYVAGGFMKRSSARAAPPEV